MENFPKVKLIASNRKVNFQYEVITKYEAGLVLLGTEVKSLRESRVNLQDAYAKFIKNELWLVNCHINEYKFGNINNHDPLRNRKLLLNKRELRRIKSALEEKGLTLIPFKIYFKDSRVKIEMAVAKGKKLYDKRETIKKRDVNRNMKRYK
jgi:SsrA-binding protein